MTYNLYSAFGNEVRTKLLLCLADRPKNVTELIENCGLSQSAVSQHLAKLKSAGLVESQKQGKVVVYRVKYKAAITISRLIMHLKKEVL